MARTKAGTRKVSSTSSSAEKSAPSTKQDASAAKRRGAKGCGAGRKPSGVQLHCRFGSLCGRSRFGEADPLDAFMAS